MGEERPGVYGEEEYIARGRPMFTKIWSYEELLVVDRPGKYKAAKAQREGMQKPSNWPADTEVDTGQKWVFWLPEGWMQGVRTQETSGKSLRCYFNPEGKRFWHKKDIEKFLGRELPKEEKRAPKEDAEGNKVARVRYVTDSDAIPHWPEEDWLPRDWRICIRQLPSGLHNVYLPPNQDDGFLYHRHLVMEYLRGDPIKLSPFGSSKPMSEISSSKKDSDGTPRKKKARKHRSDGGREATAEDYEECEPICVVSLPMPREVAEPVALKRLSDAGAPRPEELLRTAEELQTELLSRGFPPNGTELIAVVRAAGGAAASAGGGQGPRLLDAISGMYYRMPALCNDRSCYQSVFIHPSSGRLVGRGIYFFWNAERKRWQIGGLSPSKAGLAFSRDSPATAAETSRRWMLLRERGEAGGEAGGEADGSG